MKNLTITLLAGCALAALAPSASAQAHFSGYGFGSTGSFHLTVAGATELEASHDLQNWTKYATLSQETTLEDASSRQTDRRFYRAHGASNMIGFIKVTVPPGKIALLGNSFATALRLDSPEARHAIFGVTNPAVKVSVYTNGNFVAHTLDAAAGNWEPKIRPIRPHEAFVVHNVGTTPLTVHLSGEVHATAARLTTPAGSSAVALPSPRSGPLAQLLTFSAKDGMQVMWFDEQTQKYQTSAFNGLDNPGKWEPALPELRPGRGFILKTGEAVTWTDAAPAQTPATPAATKK